MDNSNKNIDIKTKILVCYYQPWALPKDEIYFPIQAGKSISGFDLHIQGDDTDDNISDRNPTFSEFTAWYWGWKNIKKIYPNIEYIGLSHYRRFFALDYVDESDTDIIKYEIPGIKNVEEHILNKLNDNDIILVLPKFIGTNVYKNYERWHNIIDLDIIIDVIVKLYPDYKDSINYCFFENNTLSLYCLFITKYKLFNDYFSWLFPILFEAEKRIDVSNYNSHQKRAIAFLAERILNLYVYHNKLKVHYKPIYFIKLKNILYYIKEIIKSIYNIIESIYRFIIPKKIREIIYNIRTWNKKKK